MDIEHERLELLDAIFNLAVLVERTEDVTAIAGYFHQLSGLKAKLVALGPPSPRKKPTAKS